MLMIVGEALIGRRGICRGTGAFRVQVVVIGDLFTQKSKSHPGVGFDMLTCKNRRLEKLNELVNLYEEVDSYFQLRTCLFHKCQ